MAKYFYFSDIKLIIFALFIFTVFWDFTAQTIK